MALNYYFNTETFIAAWEEWKDYKKAEFKVKFKTERGEQCQLTYLHGISHGNEQIAVAIIHRSMGNRYQGLFELPVNHSLMVKNGQSNFTAAGTIQSNQRTAQSYFDKISGSNSQ